MTTSELTIRKLIQEALVLESKKLPIGHTINFPNVDNWYAKVIYPGIWEIHDIIGRYRGVFNERTMVFSNVHDEKGNPADSFELTSGDLNKAMKYIYLKTQSINH